MDVDGFGGYVISWREFDKRFAVRHKQKTFKTEAALMKFAETVSERQGFIDVRGYSFPPKAKAEDSGA